MDHAAEIDASNGAKRYNRELASAELLAIG
jgi:hypothetical protein